MYIPKLFALKSDQTQQVLEQADKSLRDLGQPISGEDQYDEVVLCASTIITASFRASLEMDISEAVDEVLAIDGEPDSEAATAAFWAEIKPKVIDPVLAVLDEKGIDTTSFQPWTPSGLRELSNYLAQRLRNKYLADLGSIEAAKVMEIDPKDISQLGLEDGQELLDEASPPPPVNNPAPPPPPAAPVKAPRGRPKKDMEAEVKATLANLEVKKIGLSPGEDEVRRVKPGRPSTMTPGQQAKATEAWGLFRAAVDVDRDLIVKKFGISASSFSNYYNAKTPAKLDDGIVAAMKSEVEDRLASLNLLAELINAHG